MTSKHRRVMGIFLRQRTKPGEDPPILHGFLF
jgi:hypothetical protein